MLVNQTHSSMLISPARTIVGKVELFEGSTLIHTFKHTDALTSFTVSRSSEQKFFGFGFCQKIEVKLVDKERAISVLKGQVLKASYGVANNYLNPYPEFYIDTVTRNENTNELTIVGYDKLYSEPQKHVVNDLTLELPYTVLRFAQACAEMIGTNGIIIVGVGADETCFDTVHEVKPNFNGTETLRQALDDVAEVTQTVYYIDTLGRLVFKRLDRDGAAALLIGKANYFTLTAKEPCVLNGVGSTTELGNNVVSSLSDEDYVYYARDNGFWELREDIGSLLDNALVAVGGTVICPFSCKWRGNYLLEIGDKIEIITKDDESITAYVMDEQVTYNGGLSSTLSFEYKNTEKESHRNPTTLGEALNLTTSKVDKVNKQIDLLVSDVQGSNSELSAIKMTQDAIVLQVEEHEVEIEDLKQRASMSITKDEVKIEVEKTLNEGVDEVVTKTGFVFGDSGLDISKTDSEMSTKITEDGMTVYRSGSEVLVANNEGVKAEDLHATTYLLIGNNSRFEDYGYNRTGCFWIGEWEEATE